MDDPMHGDRGNAGGTAPSFGDGLEGGPECYERYFVPAIGAPLAAELVEVAGLPPEARVLDVACGTGVAARLAAERVGPRGKVAGLDADPGMLAVARSVGGPMLEWHHSRAEEMPLADDSFDVALCQMGLQFFEDKPAALREIRRVLAPGGRLVASLPGPTPEPFEHFAQGLATHVSPDVGGFVNAVFSLHDGRQIREMLEGAGFSQVSVNATTRRLHLPAPADFLWQYVCSTPLAPALAAIDDQQRTALEREVVSAWQPFTHDGGLDLDLGVTYAVARA